MEFSMISSAVLLGFGLAMDAFAVSVCKGLAAKTVKFKHMCIAGLWFGGFQAFMPLVGFFLGSSLHSYIERVDHWVAFILLCIIGVNMLFDGFSKKEAPADASFSVKTMFIMAVATSIDALAVGVALAMEEGVNIWLSVSSIGIITFILSAVGVKLGGKFGERYKSKAELAGGIILIFIGFKILFQHLGIL